MGPVATTQVSVRPHGVLCEVGGAGRTCADTERSGATSKSRMKQITWTPRTQKLSDLKDWDKNPRTITGEALERLKRRIEERGFHDIVKVDTDNVILSGTQRRKALTEMGIEEVWTMVPSRKLTEAERKAVVLESNRNEGADDWAKLKEYFSAEELLGGGFGKDEIARFFDNAVEVEEDDFDAEAEAARLKVVVPKNGDIWKLGDHRLACGDSTDPAVYEKLMDGMKADMCWTDPPYNIGWDYDDRSQNKFNSKRKTSKVFQTRVFKDKWTPDKYIDFLKRVFDKVFTYSIKNATIYVCHGGRYQSWTVDAIKKAGFHYSQDLIWVKERMLPMPGQLFHHLYEGIVVGWKKGESPIRNFKFNQEDVFALGYEKFKEYTGTIIDVWFEKRDKLNTYEHPTQKPVRLPERAIKKSCPLGGVVLEPFCGSGSALIACEQLNRKCYAVELDPRYCDVIVRRWQRYTKRTAECLTRPEAVILEA